MILQELVTHCAEQLKQAGVFCGHGTDNVHDEALLMALHVLDINWQDREVYLCETVPADKADEIQSLVLRRIRTRKPAAYLMGEAHFCELIFSINDKVLVPRSPIAELIRDGFQPWIGSLLPGSILDLCGGSGCIGIACAYHIPECRVDISDISEQALTIAHENSDRLELKDRVNIVRSDLYEQLPGRKYDLIISNPPYVSQQEYETLPQEYRHEPEIGLVAEDEGLALVEKIIRQAPEYLNEQGYLIAEVGNTMTSLMSRYPDFPAIWPDFEHGGEGVFIISAQELKSWLQQNH